MHTTQLTCCVDLLDLLADLPHYKQMGFDEAAAPMIWWSQPRAADAAAEHFTYEELIQVVLCGVLALVILACCDHSCLLVYGIRLLP